MLEIITEYADMPVFMLRVERKNFVKELWIVKEFCSYDLNEYCLSPLQFRQISSSLSHAIVCFFQFSPEYLDNGEVCPEIIIFSKFII